MEPLVEVRNVHKYFDKNGKSLKAIEATSFDIFPGEVLGLVGESGCGKSTLAKLLLKLIEPTIGTIRFEGKEINALNRHDLFEFRKKVSGIFQDPYASLNPRLTIQDIVGEPLDIHHAKRGQERRNHIEALLHLVGLSPKLLLRFPHELSGGQRQRIGIARALSLNPHFLICDEPLSSLDVSVQAQIINLLKSLQDEMGLTYLFVSHDLRVVKYLSSRVAVMYLGHIVEIATSDELYSHPLHPYTQALLSAIPLPHPELERTRRRTILRGELPNPLDPPIGCPFSTRCPHAEERCFKEKPSLFQVEKNHYAACHLLPLLKESADPDPALCGAHDAVNDVSKAKMSITSSSVST